VPRRGELVGGDRAPLVIVDDEIEISAHVVDEFEFDRLRGVDLESVPVAPARAECQVGVLPKFEFRTRFGGVIRGERVLGAISAEADSGGRIADLLSGAVVVFVTGRTRALAFAADLIGAAIVVAVARRSLTASLGAVRTGGAARAVGVVAALASTLADRATSDRSAFGDLAARLSGGTVAAAHQTSGDAFVVCAADKPFEWTVRLCLARPRDAVTGIRVASLDGGAVLFCADAGELTDAVVVTDPVAGAVLVRGAGARLGAALARLTVADESLGTRRFGATLPALDARPGGFVADLSGPALELFAISFGRAAGGEQREQGDQCSAGRYR